MKKMIGTLRKMSSLLKAPVEYQMIVGDEWILLNELLEKKFHFHFTGNIYCIHCGRKTRKSFQQGYCYPCMQRLNECGNCAIFPERCLVEEGNCPTDDWAHVQCHSPQIIYLSNTSRLKVGITREKHIPIRWIDQGAIQAIPIFEASNRYRAGLMEVALKTFVSDRTNWRVMLTNRVNSLNMFAERDRLLQENEAVIHKVLTAADNKIKAVSNQKTTSIKYPVIAYPEKIVSLSLERQPDIEGVLLGIKGQYLIFDNGVLNIRKYGGYEIALHIT